MRIPTLLTVLGLALSVRAADPFVVPQFLKDLDQLQEAKKEAADLHKGISFLLMEPGST